MRYFWHQITHVLTLNLTSFLWFWNRFYIKKHAKIKKCPTIYSGTTKKPLYIGGVVEINGLEPSTSWMPFKRSTRWAISPRKTQLARGDAPRSLFCFCLNYSSGLIAPTGQPSSQAPQSMQTSGSIWYCVSPWEIALTGQVSAQAPQEMHSEEILCAISFYLRLCYNVLPLQILYHNFCD